MALIELVEKAADADLMREILLQPVAKRSFDPMDRMKVEEGRRLAFAAESIMDAEAEMPTGAAKGARTVMRENHRNGYRERDWDTRAGRIELAIPKLRKGAAISPDSWSRAARPRRSSWRSPLSLRPCMDGSCMAGRSWLSDVWSAAALYAASKLRLGSRAP